LGHYIDQDGGKEKTKKKDTADPISKKAEKTTGEKEI